MTELSKISTLLCSLVKERSPELIDSVPTDLHPVLPSISQKTWDLLGDELSTTAENLSESRISGEKWISIRCDGSGFSKKLKRMERNGILPQGYSEEFADIMRKCCLDLMKKFNSKCGFTQSDEITVLLEPAPISMNNKERNEEQLGHIFNGRVQKLSSLGAATVTARFNYEIAMLCQKKGLEYSTDDLATFDARVGAYETQQEAISLLLWRASDCHMNGISDAVYKSLSLNNDKKSKILRTNRGEKLKWLHRSSLLPLPAHQSMGSYYVRQKCIIQCINKKTGTTTTCLRSRIVQQLGNDCDGISDGNLINLFKRSRLFPPDETLC